MSDAPRLATTRDTRLPRRLGHNPHCQRHVVPGGVRPCRGRHRRGSQGQGRVEGQVDGSAGGQCGADNGKDGVELRAWWFQWF